MLVDTERLNGIFFMSWTIFELHIKKSSTLFYRGLTARKIVWPSLSWSGTKSLTVSEQKI